jgi:arylsulfatase A-like enzyme
VLAIDQPGDQPELARLRAQYFGMVGHVDHQTGRLFDALRRLGRWHDRIVVVTSDHGEMLGDHGLKEQLGYREQSDAIPCIVRDPQHAAPTARWSTDSPRAST